MKISVAMCTYNGERYLRDQLDSIATQTRPPDELVVCDDVSTDATNEIVADFSAAVDFTVRHYLNEQNLGSTKNFERAIGLCEGDVIALSDQDDVWRTDKLELIEKCFSRSPETGMVFSDAEIVDEELRILGDLWNESGFDKSMRARIREGKAFEILLPAWWVTGATMAFHSKFKDLVLPIPNDIPMIHDGWISLVIAAVAGITIIEEPLILYRQHTQQQLGAPAKQNDVPRKTKLKLLAKLKTVGHPHSYGDLIRTLTAVHSRLAQKPDVIPASLSSIEDRLKHMTTRSNLPASTFRRLPLVLRELLTSRYLKYSNGIASAARDILDPLVDRN